MHSITNFPFISFNALHVPKQNLEICIAPVVNDDIAKDYNAQQAQYIKMIFEICKDVIQMLDRESPTFDDILEFVGKGRKAIAYFFKTDFAGLFGDLRRDERISTPLAGQYASMAVAIDSISNDCNSMDWELFMPEENGYKIGFRLGFTHDLKRIPLSKYLLYRSQDTLAHTYPENMQEAKKECIYLFNEIIKRGNSSSEELFYLIGELHWWLCQGCFYRRSSASCSEIICAALIQFKLGTITPYKNGVFPDRIALVSSQKDFAVLYRSLRE